MRTTTTAMGTIGKVSIDRSVWNSRAYVREGCLLRGEHYPWHYLWPNATRQSRHNEKKWLIGLALIVVVAVVAESRLWCFFCWCALSNLPKHLKLTILAFSSLLSEVGDFALLTCWRRQNPICMSINLQKIRWQRARHKQTQSERERGREADRLSCSHVVGCLLLFGGLAWVGQIGCWLMCSRSRRGDELPRD